MSQSLSLRSVSSAIQELRKQVAEQQVTAAESPDQQSALDFLDQLDSMVRSRCRNENGDPTLEFLRLNR